METNHEKGTSVMAEHIERAHKIATDICNQNLEQQNDMVITIVNRVLADRTELASKHQVEISALNESKDILIKALNR